MGPARVIDPDIVVLARDRLLCAANLVSTSFVSSLARARLLCDRSVPSMPVLTNKHHL
jgi:hypothetical protein